MANADQACKEFCQTVQDLQFPEKREKALSHLYILRHSVENFGLMLWHSFGTVAVMIEVRKR